MHFDSLAKISVIFLHKKVNLFVKYIWVDNIISKGFPFSYKNRVDSVLEKLANDTYAIYFLSRDFEKLNSTFTNFTLIFANSKRRVQKNLIL